MPSKTLIEAAARGTAFPATMTAVRHLVAAIAATETPDVLAREGIEVLPGRAVFTSPEELTVDGRVLRARAFVVATATHAYPTWSLTIQQAAAQFFGEFGGRTARDAGI